MVEMEVCGKECGEAGICGKGCGLRHCFSEESEEGQLGSQDSLMTSQSLHKVCRIYLVINVVLLTMCGENSGKNAVRLLYN